MAKRSHNRPNESTVSQTPEQGDAQRRDSYYMDEKGVELEKPSFLRQRNTLPGRASRDYSENKNDPTEDLSSNTEEDEEEESRDIRKKSNVSKINDFYSRIHAWLFPGMPEHYPLKKKLLLAKANSTLGTAWDFSLIFMSLFACTLYVAGLYDSSYEAVQVYNMAEIIYTEFFLVDFSFNWFTCQSSYRFFTDPLTIVDVLTIAPVYIGLAAGNKTNLAIFRFVRILRLIRILRAFRLLAGLSGIRRQMITLVLTLLSLIFLASGIVQLMENDVYQQLFLQCNYISNYTAWTPSCDPGNATFYSSDCDCQENYCYAAYSSGDLNFQPSTIKCNRRTFFVCFYYIIVTVSTVGYGDFSPTYGNDHQ
jgi:hypothetical protein